jgi:hypothetical protein
MRFVQQTLRLPSLQAPLTRDLSLPSTKHNFRPYSVWHHVRRTLLSTLWMNVRFPTSVENGLTLMAYKQERRKFD